MAATFLVYSSLAAAALFAQSPLQLVRLWFLACLGVGGMWPNGVALVSEAWSGLSRPLVAGVIGTSANIGIFLLATLGSIVHHAGVLALGDAGRCRAARLGVVALFAVPESPRRWLAAAATAGS